MRSILVKLGLAALIIGGLAGCGGASIGISGINGGGTGTSNGTIVAGARDVRSMSAADFQALRPQIDPASISVTITPQTGTYPNLTGGTVVKYKVTDQNGNPIVGLGLQSNNPAQTNVTHVPTNYDISFTLAKLIPAKAGEPSRWVNYFVTKLAVASGSSATPASAVVPSDGISWTGQYPSADSNGTIIDNGDGTYQYTMLRDPTQTAAIVSALPTTWTIGTSTYNKADLGDPATELNYDPAATTRLGILLTGSQPNTGSAVPGGVQPSNGPNAVPLVYTLSQAFDFVPNGSPVANTREIVQASSCDGCHDNVSQKRGLGHISTASATNGIPPGAYIGRNDPRLCVACHTNQAGFGFPVVTSTTNADGSPAYNGAYYKVDPATVPPVNTAAFIYPRMIHQTHMGNQLIKTGYNLNGHAANCSSATLAGPNAAQCFNLVGLPQDQRNCTKCHDGNANKSDGTKNLNQTKDGNNWLTQPSQVACGACHDGINFITGAGITLADRDADIAAKRPVGTTHSGHGGNGGNIDNSLCTTCHKTGGNGDKLADIQIAHATPYPSLNSVGLHSAVKTISYNLKSVTVNTSNQPVFTFQILVNGAAVTTLPAVPTVVNASSGATVVDPTFQVIPGLIGGPSFYVAYGVPMDGITSPADFNCTGVPCTSGVSLSSLLVASGSPKTGTITGPDGSGYFTATLTGDTVGQPVPTGCTKPTAPALATCNNTAILAAPIVIPATAKMVTGAIIGSFTQVDAPDFPYTYANVTTKNPTVSATGGVAVVGDLKKMVATGYTARRVVTSAALCNNCHDRLGTSPNFHGGARNDPTVCAFCHSSVRVGNGGWNENASTWLHGIHGASKRTVAFTGAGNDFSTVLYPGQLKDCNQCHLPNTVNFGATAGLTGGTLQPNLLWSYGATGTMAARTATAVVAPTTTNAASGVSVTTTNSGNSPYVTVGTNYGNVFGYTMAGQTVSSYTPSTGTAVAAYVAPAGGATVPADPANLVSSPISAACFSCHDDFTAKNHMQNNGGVIYQPRGNSAALNNTEGCLACHGQGTLMDPAVIHQQQ